MNVYILEAEEMYQSVVPVKDEDWDLFSRFDGRSMIVNWSPVKIEYNTEDFGDLPHSDFPSFETHVPVFSSKAVDKLSDILTANGELLQLDCNGEVYFAYNVTSVIDALDLQDSEVVRFSTGRVMDITKYAFISRSLLSASIFKSPETALMYVFVTDIFVDIVKKSALTGISFRLVFSVP